MSKMRRLPLWLTVAILAAWAIAASSHQQARGAVGDPYNPGYAGMSEATLVQQLANPEESTGDAAQREILRRFATTIDPAVYSPLTQTLANVVDARQAEFRAECALALQIPVMSGSPVAIQALIRALEGDSSRSVRAAAATVLSGAPLAPYVGPALQQAASGDPDPGVRAIAAGWPMVVPGPPGKWRPAPGLAPRAEDFVARELPLPAGKWRPAAGWIAVTCRDSGGWATVWVREVADRLACQVVWNEKEKSCTVSNDNGILIRLTEGDAGAQLKGQGMRLVTAPVILDGRMFVPLGFLAQALKFDFAVDTKAGIAYIWPVPTAGGNLRPRPAS